MVPSDKPRVVVSFDPEYKIYDVNLHIVNHKYWIEGFDTHERDTAIAFAAGLAQALNIPFLDATHEE